MSQYFNSVRFGRLLRKHVAEHLASYAVSLAALFGIAVLVLSGANYMMTGSFQETEQAAFFTLLLLAAGAFFTSTIFRPLGQVRQAAEFLTLPASHLEKYLVAWLLSGPLFVMFYIPIFYAADWLVLQVSATPNEPVQHLFNLFANKSVVTNWLLLAYPLVHGLALYGSIFFHRAQFVKTVGVGFVGLVLLFVANKPPLLTRASSTCPIPGCPGCQRCPWPWRCCCGRRPTPASPKNSSNAWNSLITRLFTSR